MNPRTPLRILQISDLHLTEAGLQTEPTRGLKPLAVELRENIGKTFLAHIKTKYGTNKELRPQLVLVSGDLVERGDNEKEFDAALQFLFELSEILEIHPKKFLIVPGNHDVDWKVDFKEGQRARFANYLKATRPFTGPELDNEGKPVAITRDFSDLVAGVSLTITLLISPTFSGVPDEEGSELVFKRVKAALRGVVPNEVELAKLEATIGELKGIFDIGAIGPDQRAALSSPEIKPGDDENIRIAVLHHHLLPDPHLDISPYDAVVDAGRVIDSLLGNNFDLVLTGHKHSQRWVSYGHQAHNIDIYSAPSLFKGSADSPAGYSMIEIYGAAAPTYATIHIYQAPDYEVRERYTLVREGRLLPAIRDTLIELLRSEQEELLPPITALREFHEWSREHVARDVARGAWDEVARDLEKLGKQQLTFRHPQLPDQWARLLDLAAKSPKPELRLVSDNDLAFWVRAMEAADQAALLYESPLRSYKQPKTRLVILKRYDIIERRETLERIVQDMVEHGFKVAVTPRERVGDLTDRDFGIIGSIAVSKFVRRGDEVRALTEDLSSEAFRRVAAGRSSPPRSRSSSPPRGGARSPRRARDRR
jgi:hypothetical protein